MAPMIAELDDAWKCTEADRLELSGPPCGRCAHPFGVHGDRAVVACCTPTLSPRHTVIFCNCPGWAA